MEKQISKPHPFFDANEWESLSMLNDETWEQMHCDIIGERRKEEDLTLDCSVFSSGCNITLWIILHRINERIQGHS